jgi:hypothetical protein
MFRSKTTGLFSGIWQGHMDTHPGFMVCHSLAAGYISEQSPMRLRCTWVHGDYLRLWGLCIWVGVGIAIGTDYDSDSDPDTDPESFLDCSRVFSKQDPTDACSRPCDSLTVAPEEAAPERHYQSAAETSGM